MMGIHPALKCFNKRKCRFLTPCFYVCKRPVSISVKRGFYARKIPYRRGSSYCVQGWLLVWPFVAFACGGICSFSSFGPLLPSASPQFRRVNTSGSSIDFSAVDWSSATSDASWLLISALPEHHPARYYGLC